MTFDVNILSSPPDVKTIVGISIEYFNAISSIASVFALFLTVVYIHYTRKTLMHLQEESKKGNNLARENLEQARLIDISRQWNSLELVRARNLAFKTYAASDDLKVLYNTLRKHDMERWIDISLVAHFFVRISRLIKHKQLNSERVSEEFGGQIEDWCPVLYKIYEGVDKESRVKQALKDLFQHYYADRDFSSLLIGLEKQQ